MTLRRKIIAATMLVLGLTYFIPATNQPNSAYSVLDPVLVERAEAGHWKTNYTCVGGEQCWSQQNSFCYYIDPFHCY